MSSPVSANITKPTPSTPKAYRSDLASSTFTASCDARCSGGGKRPKPFSGSDVTAVGGQA